MTPSELSYILLRDEYHVLDITPEDFSKLESYIGRRAYVFKSFKSELAENNNLNIGTLTVPQLAN